MHGPERLKSGPVRATGVRELADGEVTLVV
jgi:hypothetical protein